MFVCFGNICRSPMAEGIAKAYFKSGRRVTVKSAGLAAVNGNLPSENAVRVCKSHGIDIRDHRARAVSPGLLKEVDAVFCMERYQCQEVQTLLEQKVAIRLVGEGVPGGSCEISDPYGKGLETYEQTFRDLNKAIMFHFGDNTERRKHDSRTKASG